MTKLKGYLCSNQASSSSSSNSSSNGNREHQSCEVFERSTEKEQSATSCQLARRMADPAAFIVYANTPSASKMNQNGDQQVAPMSSAEQSHQRQYRESKWWRSCWNGNQLDGELLYKTIKAQQERRLATRMLSLKGETTGDNQLNPSANQSALVDGSSQSYVYASPKPRLQVAEVRGRCSQAAFGDGWQTSSSPHHRSPVTSSLGRSGSSPSSTGSSSSSSSASRSPVETGKQAPSEISKPERCQSDEDDDEDDPLSDPLYASILGTSKQLQAINGGSTNHAAWSPARSRTERQQAANGNKQREFYASPRKTITVNNSLYADFRSPVGRPKSTDNKLLSLVEQEQQHVYDNLPGGNNGADPASMQLKSLVERCLEVQRATRNSSLLAPIEDEKIGQEEHHIHHREDNEYERQASSSVGDDQT